MPPRTIIAQHTALVVDENITRCERPVVQSFMDFLLSDAGQQILGRYHMRPATDIYEEVPSLIQPFTVEDLGGWFHAYTKLVEPKWQSEFEPRLDLDMNPTLLGPKE